MSRITIFAGHYGSGKTNIAVNYALRLKNQLPAIITHNSVAIADLDIVNPYFRTVDAEKILSENGIRLIVSEFAESNVDLPSLPAEAYSVIDDKTLLAVLDVGGDDRGALALGRYSPGILSENDFRMLLVVNTYRPLSRTAEDIIGIKNEIEQAGGIPFDGIVNNSNIGDETSAKDVLKSLPVIGEVSAITGLPVVFTSVLSRLAPELGDKIDNLFPVDIYVKQG
ncbi:MAG: hypothetical protein K6G90_11735 [Clostridia bacterium]|nr:hypothetical protein [Clostridia bacterium]